MWCFNKIDSSVNWEMVSWPESSTYNEVCIRNNAHYFFPSTYFIKVSISLLVNSRRIRKKLRWHKTIHTLKYSIYSAYFNITSRFTRTAWRPSLIIIRDYCWIILINERTRQCQLNFDKLLHTILRNSVIKWNLGSPTPLGYKFTTSKSHDCIGLNSRQ